jgi:Carboxypeptidase regulatory-like domain/TonB-dependent Receptor Plug Domain
MTSWVSKCNAVASWGIAQQAILDFATDFVVLFGSGHWGISLVLKKDLYSQGECMNWKRFFVAMFALLAALSIGSNRLAAQTATTGDISGIVTDQTGAIVPDAKVTLKDNSKGSVQDANTTREGTYRFFLLAPGSYTVTVGATGFSTSSRTGDVSVGQVAVFNIQLSLGASTTSVTVTEAAPLLQTDNGDTGTTMSEQQISQVPNPGNDLSYVAQMAPGVVMNTMGGFGNVEAFGLPATSNLFTMNGMDDNDPFLNLNNSGATNLLLGSNEIQEADVVTNGYSAAYGTFAGINVNYVTKSGGNDFHGNAVYYWSGRAFDATDWISHADGNPKPFNNANQWAASLGGPIKKDKLFFFLNTEGLRVLIPVPAQIQVPTVAFEQATIANLNALGLTQSIPFYCQNLPTICPGSAAVPGSGAGLFNLYNAVPNQGSATALPNSCSAPSTPGNLIPASLGGICANVINETPINFAPEWQLAGRVDWNIGANDRAFFRLQYDHGVQPSVTDPINPVFNITSDQPEWQGQLVETHTFSPTLVNQFLIAGTWYSAIFKPTNQAAATAAYPGGTLLFGDGSFTNIGGAINFVFPQGRNVTQFQIGDDVTKTMGNNAIKFGFKFHRDWVSDHDLGFFTNPLQVAFSNGDFFNGGITGSEQEQAFVNTQNVPIRINNIAGYIQDEWRVKPNLTITASLRLEHNSNPNCVTDCFSTFAGGFNQAVANEGDPYNSIIQTGRSSALYKYQNLQWEPRASFAWQPFGSTATGMLRSNLVVRGGVGIFYDIFPGQIADNMAENSPLYNLFTVAPAVVNGSCAGGALSPNETTLGGNLFDCASGANTAFVNAFNSGASSVAAPPSITTAQLKTEAPQYQKWSLQIQKGFGANDSIDIGYYGTHGIHTPVLNGSVNAFGFGSLPAVAPTDQFAQVTEVQDQGISNYNGLVASYKHRFTGMGGGVIQLNYTWSHAFDEISNGGFDSFSGNSIQPQDPFNLRNNYGPSDYDIRQNFNANYVWQVPIRKMMMGHGWAPLVDGWQVSGTVFYHSGLPYTVFDTGESDALNSNNYFGQIWPDVINPNVKIGCSNFSRSVQTAANPLPTSCLSTADFVTAGTETGFGANGLRNKFRGPSYFNSDFSVTKNTRIPHWERGTLGIGFQFFNVFNHPNFGFPNADVGSPSFGQVQSLVSPPTSILGSFLGGDASPRLIQLKANITF